MPFWSSTSQQAAGAVCILVLAAASQISAAENSADSPRVVMVTANPLKPTHEGRVLAGDPICRELPRQAVLMAAREEFGLATRDEALLEPVESGTDDTIDVIVYSFYYNKIHIELRHRGKPVFQHEIRIAAGGTHTYEFLDRKCEALSRGMFVEAMKEMGFEPKPNRYVESAPLPDEVETLLLQMNHISQYRAVREIHRMIRESGESPERLAGLARGYANLSQLMLSGPDHRTHVYRARGLLYAKRLKYRVGDKSILGNAIEGYAYVIMGGVSYGLSRLEIADQLAKADQGVELPAWHSLLVDYSHYRHTKLKDAAETDPDSPLLQLAALLWFRAALQSTSMSMSIETGKKALDLAPDCLWITDEMLQSSGVKYNHVLTQLGPQQHSRHAPILKQVEGVPPEVQELLAPASGLLDEFQWSDIANLLVEASKTDFQEPSLAVLGRDIEAWNTVHIARRANFLKYSLGVSAAEYIDEMRDAIEGHPMLPLLMTYRLPPGSEANQYEAIVGDYEFVGGNVFLLRRLLWTIPGEANFKNMSTQEARNLVWHSHGNCEQDYRHMIRRYELSNDRKDCVAYAKRMESISLHSPLRIAMLIMYDWDASQPKLAQWKELYGDQPMVSFALGRHMREQGQYAEAITQYEKYLEAAPDIHAFQELANCYFQQGDDATWLATMKRLFEYEDYGLDHGRAAKAIAATLMHKGQFQDALPWAEIGARTGSGDTIAILVDCLTALGRFDEAEKRAEYATRRYAGNYYWYNWCAETGKGNLEAAWDLKQRLLEGLPPDHRDQAFAQSMHLLVKRRREDAGDMLQGRLEKKFSPWDTMTLALLHDEFDEEQQRDAVLEQLATHDYKDEPRVVYSDLAVVFQLALKSGELDPAALQKVLAEHNARKEGDWTAFLDYFVGVFLANRGKMDEAIERWKTPARFSSSQWVRILAWDRLREAGVDPVHIDGRYFDGQFWKAEKPESP